MKRFLSWIIKRPFSLIICSLFFLLFAFSSTTLAHSGRTDENGGHYDRSTGEYHYHHGYPAHQHEDGICPYDFDDRTGWDSGSHSVSVTDEHVKDNVAEFRNSSGTGEGGSIITWLFTILGGGYAGFLCIVIASSVFHDHREKKREKEYYSAQYSGKHMSDLIGIPPRSIIGADGLPKEKGAQKWGKYTVYVTNSGHSFHRILGCSKARIEKNIAQCQFMNPCKRCYKDNLPSIEWYQSYKSIKETCQNYHIKVIDDCVEKNP